MNLYQFTHTIAWINYYATPKKYVTVSINMQQRANQSKYSKKKEQRGQDTNEFEPF